MKLINIAQWQTRLFLKAISYPCIITLLGIVPFINAKLFFIHAGFGWFLLLPSLVWVIFVSMRGISKRPPDALKLGIPTLFIIWALYLALSALLALILKIAFRAAGNETPYMELWSCYLVPISYLFL